MNKRETEEGRNVEVRIFRSKSSVVYMKFISHVYIKMGSRSKCRFQLSATTKELDIYHKIGDLQIVFGLLSPVTFCHVGGLEGVLGLLLPHAIISRIQH